MPSPRLILASLVACTLSANAGASVMDAYTNTSMTIVSDQGNPTLTSASFGTHDFQLPGAGAQVTTGLNQAGAPIIHVDASTVSTRRGTPSAGASLGYGWMVTGDGNSPVLVHISTAGYVHYQYEFAPDKLDTYNLSPNLLNVGILAIFNTTTSTGYDQRKYGLQTGGNLNWGIQRVQPTNDYTQQNGGTSIVNADFAEQFDLWVMPNLENNIALGVDAFLYSFTSYLTDYATEKFTVDALIDPIITIDAQFANNYQLDVSPMPAIGNVPEPSAAWLFVSGIAVLGALRKKNRGARPRFLSS